MITNRILLTGVSSISRDALKFRFQICVQPVRKYAKIPDLINPQTICLGISLFTHPAGDFDRFYHRSTFFLVGQIRAI